MKKLLTTLLLGIVLSVAAVSGQANAESKTVPNGLYTFTGKTEFVPLSSFLTKSAKEKRSILAGDYYLIVGGDAYKTMNIIIMTDNQLDNSKQTVSELENKYDITVDEKGNISTGFEVVEIE